LNRFSRRRFLGQLAVGSAASGFAAASDHLAATPRVFPLDSKPSVKFPTAARERISVASYPFRAVIAGLDDGPSPQASKMDIKEFAAHVSMNFQVNKIEPWSRHFRSLDRKYLDEVRAGTEKAGGAIVDIAADGEHSPYAADREERVKAVEFSKQWIGVASIVGSPSVRTNIPAAKDTKPDVERTVESLRRVAEHASANNVVVHLENDNPVSEDPFFVVQVIEKVDSPWLRALPDFANTLTTGNEEHAYKGLDGMFAYAYGICHVKAKEANDAGQIFHVDLARAFGMLKAHGYKGYCSMEYDSPGDPYAGTKELIAATVRYLS
jgi:sugar phosphate isomerase/epimerase